MPVVSLQGTPVVRSVPTLMCKANCTKTDSNVVSSWADVVVCCGHLHNVKQICCFEGWKTRTGTFFNTFWGKQIDEKGLWCQHVCLRAMLLRPAHRPRRGSDQVEVDFFRHRVSQEKCLWVLTDFREKWMVQSFPMEITTFRLSLKFRKTWL